MLSGLGTVTELLLDVPKQHREPTSNSNLTPSNVQMPKLDECAHENCYFICLRLRMNDENVPRVMGDMTGQLKQDR